jgi:hypothetical protein
MTGRTAYLKSLLRWIFQPTRPGSKHLTMGRFAMLTGLSGLLV